MLLVRAAQHRSIPDDVGRLLAGKPLHRESRLLKLTPYLDDMGLLRVGGRLTNARIEEEAKHPLLLNPKHALTPHVIPFGCSLRLVSLRHKLLPICKCRPTPDTYAFAESLIAYFGRSKPLV